MTEFAHGRSGRLRRRLVAGCGVIALTTLGVLAAASPASASGTAYLRLAHLSPDTPTVDVYVTSASDPADNLVLRGVDYGTLSDYQRVDGGTYTVSMRPAGAPADTPPVIATSVLATEGSAHTVAGVGPFADLGLRILDDDLTLPPAGQARVRVIQASAAHSSLDVAIVGGQALGTGVAFATTTPYSTVPAGQWTLHVSGAGTSSDLPVTLAAGGVYSVLILDQGTGGLTVSAQVDAASTEVVPAGGIETGAGAMAPRSSGTAYTLLGSAALLLGLAGLARRRHVG